MRSDTVKLGFERAPHRSLLRATGNFTSDDVSKPFVAIVNSHVDIIPGHAHLAEVGQYLKRAVRAAGGVPFVFHTIGVDDGIAMGHEGMKFSLPSREIIADSVETMVEAHCFDGMICVPNCDKIVPGMMMAAVRCNLPTIFVSGGPMAAGAGGSDLISVFYGVAEHNAGELSADELAALEEAACPTCGSCSGMFTANSMNCLCEALGLALPGNGTTLAVSPARRQLYDWAAERIVELIAEDLKPRDIVTAESIDNALRLDMAMGGSTNTILHTLAIAHEAGVDYDIERINRLSATTPNLCKVSPSSAYHVQDVHASGGIHTILGELVRHDAGLLDLDCPTVTGLSLGDNIAAWDLRSPAACPAALDLYVVGGEPPVGRKTRVEDILNGEVTVPNGTAALARGLAAAWNAGNAPAFRSLLSDGCERRAVGGDGIPEDIEAWFSASRAQPGTRFPALPGEVDGEAAVLACMVREGAEPARMAVFTIDAVDQGRVAALTLDWTPARAASAKATFGAALLSLDPYDCIRTGATAYSPTGGLSILFGNLAPDGAVVKSAGVLPEMLRHEGPAVVFESQEEACSGILGGRVKAGDVVVIRYEGPRGGPGMQEMLAPTSYIKGMKLDSSVALITDGRFSGGTAGACIGHVSPEAAAGGLIALVEPGDRIRVDIPAGELALLVDEAELADRRAAWRPPAPRYTRGWLARYTGMATSASSGAVLRLE